MDKQKSRHIGTLSPEMALLGQLYENPGHGYDLHRRVITDLGHVWHLSQSQAYAILKRLEVHGDLSVEQISQEKLPPRQLLHLTNQGRQRFLDWMEATSGGSTRAIRLEFVTRLYFLQKYMPEKISQAFERQKKEACNQIRRLEDTYAGLPGDQVYNRISVQFRIKQLTLILEWLDDCQMYFPLSSSQ